MADANLIDNIIGGKFPGEQDRDLLLMTVAMALAMTGAEENGQVTSQGWQEAVDRAGRILCPLFDYAKLESYKSAMEEVRRSYAGIATDFDLQLKYWVKVVSLAKAGDLISVARAVEADIPMHLHADRRAIATM